MTQIPFGYFLHYLTETDGLQWRNTDYNMRIVVRGLKQEPFKGYADFKIAGAQKRFDEKNIEELMEPLLAAFAKKLKGELTLPVSVVPIPNSNMAIGEAGSFRNEYLASLVAKHLGNGSKMVPALRWRKQRDKSHLTREIRSPDLYEPHLVLVKAPASPVLLFDDVLTSGSQMIACARFLAKKKHRPVFAAVVAKATKQQFDPMIKWTVESLELDRATTVFD